MKYIIDINFLEEIDQDTKIDMVENIIGALNFSDNVSSKLTTYTVNIQPEIVPYKRNGDFRKFYDTTQKRNFWILGYFGGGSINIVDAYQLAQEYAEANKVPLQSVQIDEIFSSRRFKGFKFIYSQAEQEIEADTDLSINNVYAFLRD